MFILGAIESKEITSKKLGKLLLNQLTFMYLSNGVKIVSSNFLELTHNQLTKGAPNKCCGDDFVCEVCVLQA